MRRILIIQTASIGDAVLATAQAESLHNAVPGVKIDILVRKGHEQLFDGHPFIHEVLTWQKRGQKYRNLFRLIMKIRRNRYDLVVNLQRFFSSGLMTVFSGATETRGFSKNPLSFLFTVRKPHPIGNSTHETERNQRLIEDIAGKTPLKPRLYPGPAAEEMAGKMVIGPAVTISPSSLWFTKQFPAQRWAELAAGLPGHYQIFLLGGKTDENLCSQVVAMANHPGITPLAGSLSFLESAALMKLCRMNFTNDSAPLHFASAVDAPVTAVFCSTVTDFGFGPLSSDASVIEVEEKLTCRPCGLHGKKECPEKHFRCAMDIDIRRLLHRAEGGEA